MALAPRVTGSSSGIGLGIAAQWLERHCDSLGKRSTVDIRREFLE